MPLGGRARTPRRRQWPLGRRSKASWQAVNLIILLCVYAAACCLLSIDNIMVSSRKASMPFVSFPFGDRFGLGNIGFVCFAFARFISQPAPCLVMLHKDECLFI